MPITEKMLFGGSSKTLDKWAKKYKSIAVGLIELRLVQLTHWQVELKTFHASATFWGF